MRRIVEPSAMPGLQLLLEHRPNTLARILSDIPSEITEMIIRRGRDYDVLLDKGREFLEYYETVCSDKYLSHDWFSDKAWAWHDILAPYVGQPCDVLELGVFEGRSVIYILEYLRNSRVTALDHFVLKKGWTSSQGITIELDNEIAFQGNIRSYGDRVRTIVQPSWVGLSNLIRERQKFDIIYIDASHTKPDVLADTLLAWRLLKIGGLFIWDDFLLDIWDWDSGPVGPGVVAFLRLAASAWEVVHAGWQVAVRKRAELTEMP